MSDNNYTIMHSDSATQYENCSNCSIRLVCACLGSLVAVGC